MKTIYKYKLWLTNKQDVLLPIGSEILTVQTQDEDPCLWVLVNPLVEDKEKRIIEIIGTGHEIKYNLGVTRNYISTFQLSGGSFVGHAFEYIDTNH
jgi:hypothetical protein